MSCGADNTIKVWNTDVNEEVVSSAQMTIMGHQKCINVVRVSPNDKLIASGSNDKSIKLWDAQSLTALGTLSGHRKGVWDLCFSPVD